MPMKERPIIFSAPMVHALLANRKTQTRRVIKPANAGSALRDGAHSKCCPYAIGMRLWVKENWHAPIELDDRLPREVPPGTPIFYAADNALPAHAGKMRTALFMPRRVSRITLEVTEVRAERLGDIGESDAKEEGVTAIEAQQHGGWITAYRMRWQAIHGEEGWRDDCYVWVVTFRVIM